MQPCGIITDLKTNKSMKLKMLSTYIEDEEKLCLICCGKGDGFLINYKTVYHVVGFDSIDRTRVNDLYVKLPSSSLAFHKVTPLKACERLNVLA